MEKRKYPIRAEDYELFELIGDGASASVRRALCITFDEIVAVKILDFERNSDLNTISHEAQTLIMINHPNVLKAHCSFVIDHELWVVTPYMAGGSCLDIMKSAYPKGFEEVIIATLLREVLNGLEYLHQQGHIHRDIKAGNILVDTSGEVKLGDLGVSASLFDSGDRQRTRNTFVGTPCWMAPEVMEHRNGYDFKADIWSFGITALELAHGHAPFSSQPPVKVFLMTLQNAPPSLEFSKDKKFSKSFKHMIATCLVKDPAKRPTAHKLLKHSFFKQAKFHDFIARKILEGLPSLSKRYQGLKLKEAELLAERKMLDGEKEAMSQKEYKRGISEWNFDIEDLKAQASLITDNEDSVSGKDSEGSSNCLSELDSLHENVPLVMSSSMMNGASKENDGMMHSNSSPDQPAKLKSFENHHKQEQNMENCSMSHATTVISSEAIPGTPKSSASSSDDNDDKLKPVMVRLKGRFKVTSIDFDKAFSSPSQPLNLISQLEVAGGREKQLLQEIADLQKRLEISEEELKRIRAKTTEKNDDS